MAYRLIRICSTVFHSQHSTGCLITGFTNGLIQHNVKLNNRPELMLNIVRHASFFNRYPAEYLWKGATAVSNAGKKRGRGKSRRPIKNLNRGQMIGYGKINMLWPGLNAPVMRGRELIDQQRLPDDPEREQNILKLRDTSTKRRRQRIHPLERGWTSAKPGGRKIGPPDPIGDDKFEGFESIILEFKQVTHMTGNLGRKRSVSSFVVTGNGNGIGGFGLGRATEGRPSLRKAKNRAGQRLMYIKRYNERTVYHDFFTQFGNSKIYVSKKGEGYGLRCHRAIKAICEVLGIKDLHAKIEGSTMTQNITKAFFLGLLRQRTHEEIAEDKKLHLVEFREERDHFPVVVASPTEVRKADEIKPGEIMDFTRYVLDGKVYQKEEKKPPFYTRLPSWERRLRKTAYLRNKDEVKVRMMAEDGALKSFYTDKYKEADPTLAMKLWKKSRESKTS